MRYKKQWERRFAVGLFLLCVSGLIWLLWMETVPQREAVRLRPDTGSVLEMDNPPSYVGPLSLSFSLPEWEELQRPILEIRTLETTAELWLDGTLLQTLPAGLGYSYVTLPVDCGGKTLTLTMEKGETDTIPSLFLTNYIIISEQACADACYFAFPTAAFGVLFLLTLGLFLYGWTEGARPWPVLLLSAAALGETAYFYLLNLPVFSLPAALYGLLLYQSRSLLYAAPPLFLMLGMQKWRKAFAPFAILPALVYFTVAGFQTVIPLFSYSAAYAGCVFAFTIAALLTCSALEYRDGNPVFRRFLPWLGVCVSGAVLLCAVSMIWTGALPSILHMALMDFSSFRPDTELYYWNSLLLVLCFLESAASHIQRTAERDTEIQVLSARESLMREQLATVQESTAAMRKLRHDVKNHYLVLQTLCRSGERERLDAYLSGLVSEVAAIPAFAYTHHPAINAVLTIMLARAQKHGIMVEHWADIPETLPFPDTDLCTVLMNLLQNALDANALAAAGESKWLRVDLHSQMMHLYIGVENSRFSPVDYDEGSGLCRTTKEDKTAHGYGLKAVQAVAQKYQGELLLKFPDGAFSAAAILQIPS